MRAPRHAAAGALGLLLVTGCASSSGSAGREAPDRADLAVVRTDATCLDAEVLDALGLELDASLRTSAPTGPASRGLPPVGFAADSVLVCDRGEPMRDSVGTWWSVTATRLEGDVTTLVDAVDAATPAAGCAPGVVAQVWLVDALGGGVLLPRDAACAGDAEVPAALDDLDVVERTEHPVALTRPVTAEAAGP